MVSQPSDSHSARNGPSEPGPKGEELMGIGSELIGKRRARLTIIGMMPNTIISSLCNKK